MSEASARELAMAEYNRRHAEIVDAYRRAGWPRADAVIAADENGYVNAALKDTFPAPPQEQE